MATSILTVVFEVEQDPAAFADARLSDDASRPREAMNKLAKLVGEMASKHTRGEVTTHLLSGTNRTHATGTVTFSGAGTATNKIQIGGVQFTLVSGTPTESQVDISGGTAAASGASLSSQINAHSALQGVVTATDNGAGVVTVTAVTPGLVGNNIALIDVDGDAAIAVSGVALSGFTGTEQQAQKSFACGL